MLTTEEVAVLCHQLERVATAIEGLTEELKKK